MVWKEEEARDMDSTTGPTGSVFQCVCVCVCVGGLALCGASRCVGKPHSNNECVGLQPGVSTVDVELQSFKWVNQVTTTRRRRQTDQCLKSRRQVVLLLKLMMMMSQHQLKMYHSLYSLINLHTVTTVVHNWNDQTGEVTPWFHFTDTASVFAVNSVKWGIGNAALKVAVRTIAPSCGHSNSRPLTASLNVI